MSDFWALPPSEDQESALIVKVAEQIRARKMETPAILLLEMHRPLSGFIAQSSVVFAPFMVPFLGFDAVNDYSQVFSKPENVEKLLQLLEAPEGAEIKP